MRRRTWMPYLGGFVPLAAVLPSRAGTPATWLAVKARIRSRHLAVPQLSVAALRDWLLDSARQRPLLLDVRTREEFADGHLEGAVHVDSTNDAMGRLRERPPGVTGVLYCSVGLRSSALTETLLARGARGIYNLEGSVFEWANNGNAVVANNGQTGKVHPYDREWGVLLRRELWSREP